MNFITHYLKKIKEYDAETYQHCKRVANISIFIGESVGLNKKELNTLYSSALLHDLGKLSIPKNILHKKEPLTATEFEVIRKHPQLSSNMLENPKHLTEEVMAGIISHHEFFNGQGYNKGLKGESIPLAGRIIAIADAFDAMITFRPYKTKTLTIKEASNEILDCSGEQFDPYVVRKVFIKMTEDKYIEKTNRQKYEIMQGGDYI